MTIVPLREADEAGRFGGKAAQLGSAVRAGLPVPDGFAVSAEMVSRLVEGDGAAVEAFATCVVTLDGPCAVRSSAVGEDGAQASFAGQHATRLNVCGPQAALAAVAEVWRSGRSEGALGYRRRMGADDEAQVGVVVQRLVNADVAGVLFTCCPVTGADEIVVEAGWGLGEGIVQGLVVPDRFRMARSGEVRQRVAGSKDVAIRMAADGGTVHEPVPPFLARRFCLGYPELKGLTHLAQRCDAVFGEEPHDLEWAIEQGVLFLLQRRPVTRVGAE
jgi:pyruvate, water dikinase